MKLYVLRVDKRFYESEADDQYNWLKIERARRFTKESADEWLDYRRRKFEDLSEWEIIEVK